MNIAAGVWLLIFVAFVLGEEVRDPCQINYECDKITEMTAYKNCVKSKRIKRQICPYANAVQPQVVQAIPIQAMPPNCNGGACPQIVEQACVGPSCFPTVVNSQNCINTCSQTCGGLACQDRCEQSCQPGNSVQNSTSVVQKEVRESSITSPNVTTIIKLTNIVNNTNVVNVPTNINNTNVNNLDLGTNVTNQAAANQKCCLVVQPKVCHKINPSEGESGYRCVHRKHHTCGEQCQSSTVHAQVRQPCSGPVSQCPPQVAYVPQPQPSCSYQPSWPYVQCGGQKASCAGCYDHYGYGYHNFYGSSPPSCSGCYDDGFQQGPLYRQGPVYQPGFYHAPPMMAPMMQPPMQPNCGGYGCFGNQFVDPVFGYPSYSPYSSGAYFPGPAMQQPYYPPMQQSYYPPMQQPYYPPMQSFYPQPQPYYPQPQPYFPFFDPSLNNTVNNNTKNDFVLNSSNLKNNTEVEIIPLPWEPQQPMAFPFQPFSQFPMARPAPLPPSAFHNPFMNPFPPGSFPTIIPVSPQEMARSNSTTNP